MFSCFLHHCRPPHVSMFCSSSSIKPPKSCCDFFLPPCGGRNAVDCSVGGFFLITCRFLKEAKKRSGHEFCAGFFKNISPTQWIFLPPWLPHSSPQEMPIKSEGKNDLLQLSSWSCRWSVKIRWLISSVTKVLPSSDFISTNLPSSFNWPSPHTESLCITVMLCQQRAVCHPSITDT